MDQSVVARKHLGSAGQRSVSVLQGGNRQKKEEEEEGKEEKRRPEEGQVEFVEQIQLSDAYSGMTAEGRKEQVRWRGEKV